MIEIRKLAKHGDWVVDLGSKWFRVKSDGTVVAKQTYRGRVKIRPATDREVAFAKDAVARFTECRR